MINGTETAHLFVIQKQAYRGKLWKGKQTIFLNKNNVIIGIVIVFICLQFSMSTVLFVKAQVFEEKSPQSHFKLQ